METVWLDNNKTVAIVYKDNLAKLVVDSSFRRIYTGDNSLENAMKDGKSFVNKRKLDKNVWFR